MTTRQAIALAKTDCPAEAWLEVEAVLLAANLCPSCACEGERVKLCDWEPETRDTYAGRECPQCEAFWVDAKQSPSWEPAEDYGGAFDGNQVTSDADPGL